MNASALFLLALALAANSGCGPTITELSSKGGVALIPVRCQECDATVDSSADGIVGTTPTTVTLRWRVVRERVRDNRLLTLGFLGIGQGTLGSLLLYGLWSITAPLYQDPDNPERWHRETLDAGDKWFIGITGALITVAGIVCLTQAWQTRTRVAPSRHTVGLRLANGEQRVLTLDTWSTPPRLGAIREIVFDARRDRFVLPGKPPYLRMRQRSIPASWGSEARPPRAKGGARLPPRASWRRR